MNLILLKWINKVVDKKECLQKEAYQQYKQYPEERFLHYFYYSLKNNKFLVSTIINLIMFRQNKKKWLSFQKMKLIELVHLENTDIEVFRYLTLSEFKTIYYQNRKEVAYSKILTDENINYLFINNKCSLKDIYYLNPFTQQPVMILKESEKTTGCYRTKKNYLINDFNISKIFINDQGISKIIDYFEIKNNKYDFLIKTYVLYHELAHDSYFQHYTIFKEQLNYDGCLSYYTNRWCETHADLSAIMLLIKNHDLNNFQIIKIMKGVFNLRNQPINTDDTSSRSINEETSHIHCTQPGLLLLSRFIMDYGSEIIKKMTPIHINTIAACMSDIALDSDFRNFIYTEILPIDNNYLKHQLDNMCNLKILFYYTLLYLGVDGTQQFLDVNKSIDDKLLIKDNIVSNLIDKLYNNDELTKKCNQEFRVKFSFEYAKENNKRSLYDLLRTSRIGNHSKHIYDDFHEMIERQ